MLSISWIKDEAGRLLAVWAPREPGKPMVLQRTDPSFFDWHSLREAA